MRDLIPVIAYLSTLAWAFETVIRGDRAAAKRRRPDPFEVATCAPGCDCQDGGRS